MHGFCVGLASLVGPAAIAACCCASIGRPAAALSGFRRSYARERPAGMGRSITNLLHFSVLMPPTAAPLRPDPLPMASQALALRSEA